jgi:hypothetical protein
MDALLSRPQRLRRRRRVVAVVVVAAAAAALVGVFATSGAARSSQPRSPRSPRTINFTLTAMPGQGFFPTPGQPPTPGTRYGSELTVTGDDGSKGTGYVLCTFIAGDARLCSVQLFLSSGQIVFQGIAHGPNVNEPFAVLGGTGAYAVARGSAVVNDVDPTSERTPVRFTVRLPAGR